MYYSIYSLLNYGKFPITYVHKKMLTWNVLFQVMPLICLSDRSKMAAIRMYTEASGIIATWRVSPTVLHQFVSHSVPSIPPPSFLFFSVFPSSLFQSLAERERHTYIHTPRRHESFMEAGCIIPEACSWRPTHARLRHLVSGERGRERESG